MVAALDIGPTTHPLLDATIGENLARTVAKYGKNDAVVSRLQEIRWTYDEFATRVRALATGLIGLGLEAGDRLGLWSPNYAEWVLVQYATAEIGVVLVNINPAYRTHELAYALQHSGCRMVIAAPQFKSSNYREMLDEVAPACPNLQSRVFLWDADWESLARGDATVNAAAFAARQAALRPDDPINIQYTSGTTGFPKGATLSHRNILNNGQFTSLLQTMTDRDRVCIPVPFYHCFGMVIGNLGCTTHGATIVIPSDSFDALAVLEAVEAERCTALYGVPTMFIAELAHERFGEFDLTSLRTGVMAGSPCPAEVMKACIEKMHMVDVTICYGMTETSPVSTQTLTGDTLDHQTTTVGKVHPHVEIRIADPETGETVERNVPGEFCTRGYSVMNGYWNDPERTAAAIDVEGWMHTGDLAVMADDGYVEIVGRIKDMVIRGGENIYPREIEEFLHTHPDIEDVQVIGVPDPKYGEELVAWIKPRAGSDLTEEAARSFCRGTIAHYKVPRHVKFVEEFPMTVTGKVRKVEMREQSIRDLGIDGAAGSDAATEVSDVSTSSRTASARDSITSVLDDVGNFDVLAFSWGASAPVTSGSGAGSARAGAASVQDLSLTKFTDETSPLLLDALLRGKISRRGSITVVPTDGPPITYELENVLVSSYSSGGSLGEARLTEHVSLHFSGLTYTVGGNAAVWP